MMRYEISTEPGDVRPGDLVVFRLQTKNSVKWSCGPVRCFTDDKDAPAMDGRKRPGRVYAFSCNEARTLFRELYLALCAAPPE